MVPEKVVLKKVPELAPVKFGPEKVSVSGPEKFATGNEEFPGTTTSTGKFWYRKKLVPKISTRTGTRIFFTEQSTGT